MLFTISPGVLLLTMDPPFETNEPAADDQNPWDMPGHSHGEKFAIWATLVIVVGLILVVVLVDLYRKRAGRDSLTKRWLIRLWNLMFGRIARLRIANPEGDGPYGDLEKGAGKGGKGKNNESSSEDEDSGTKARSNQPQILITKPDSVLLNSSPLFTSNPFSSPASSSSKPPSRVSEEGPGSAPSSMLDPTGSIFKGHPVHSHTRRGSHDSTNSQHSSERRVAQPIPGQLLVGRHI